MQFSLNLDAGNTAGSLLTTVTVNAGTYATAASFQAELQADVNTATDAVAGFTGAVTVKVTDLGSGVWTVDFKRNSTDSDTGIAISGIGSRHRPGASRPVVRQRVANTAGGVFQVGANVTAANQIHVSIDDVRITSGTNTTYTALANIDVTDTTQNTHRRRRSSTTRSLRCRPCEASSVPTRTGSSRRLRTCRSPRRTSPLRRAASVTPTWRPEMVNFTRDQILLQAGTAMLAQANSAPQTILKLLQ